MLLIETLDARLKKRSLRASRSVRIWAISYAINPGHHLNLQGASIKIRGQAIGVGASTCMALPLNKVSVGANPRAKT